MFKMRIYDEKGNFKMELAFQTLEECVTLWECFPRRTKPTIWKRLGDSWVRIVGY